MKIRKQFLLLFISTSHLFVYAQNTEPSMFTKEANEQVVKSLPFDNKQDFEDATRGFIATIDEPSIIDETGKEVYGLTVWDFLRQEAPASANPSLWRQGQLNRIHGLFEVLPGKIGNYIRLCTISKIIKGHMIMYPFIIQSFFSFFFPFPSFLTLQERVFRKRGSRGSIFGL